VAGSSFFIAANSRFSIDRIGRQDGRADEIAFCGASNVWQKYDKIVKAIAIFVML
jgi:hypothetical protein